MTDEEHARTNPVFANSNRVLVDNMIRREQQQLDHLVELVNMLEEAKLQLVYLDERFPTGTTPAIIARINALLEKHGI